MDKEIEDDERAQYRKRDRDHNDESRPPRAKEQKDHQSGEGGSDCAFLNNAVYRIGDEHRLIEEFLDLEAGWGCLAGNLKSLLHPTDDIHRRGISVLDDAEQDRAAVVFSDDVLLHQIAVADVTHILQEDRGAAREFDRDVVE